MEFRPCTEGFSEAQTNILQASVVQRVNRKITKTKPVYKLVYVVGDLCLCTDNKAGNHLETTWKTKARLKGALRKDFAERVNRLSASVWEEPSEGPELLSKSTSNWMWVIGCEEPSRNYRL